MTICDVWVSPDRVVALTDSDTRVETDAGIHKQETSKVFAVPHLPAIVAGAGWGNLLYPIATIAWHSRMTTAAINRMAKAVYAAGAKPLANSSDFCEVVLAGWDAAAKRMTLQSWFQESREIGFCQREPLSSFISPWNRSPDEKRTSPPLPESGAGFLALALEQVEILQRINGEKAAGGGKIILTEVTPKEVKMRELATLPRVGDSCSRLCGVLAGSINGVVNGHLMAEG